MNIAVVYIYPMVRVRKYYQLAKRFADTWKQHDPGHSCALHVVTNGGTAGPMDLGPFDGIPREVHTYSNIGWDIGAYQWASEIIPCDLLVCLGSHCNFHRPFWLSRIAEAYIENGPTLYGCRGFFYGGHHHIRTTSFWLPPQLFNVYPWQVGSSGVSRYMFEHGQNNLTEWVEKEAQLDPMVVTWDRVWKRSEWPDGFGEIDGCHWKTCLIYDQWTHPPGTKLDRE